jgi:hypothetical protein
LYQEWRVLAARSTGRGTPCTAKSGAGTRHLCGMCISSCARLNHFVGSTYRSGCGLILKQCRRMKQGVDKAWPNAVNASWHRPSMTRSRGAREELDWRCPGWPGQMVVVEHEDSAMSGWCRRINLMSIWILRPLLLAAPQTQSLQDLE